MMLEKIEIKDFQVHRDLEVEFSPLVTTIVGASDKGKSSILRAVRWLAENRPAGTAFVHHGAVTARVRLVLDGGRVIERARSEHENYYKLDGDKYVSLRDPPVPAAIEQLLNLHPVNFQGQFDAPFWFADTPGQVSKHLNEVAQLSEIDAALTLAAKDIAAQKAVVAVTEARLAEARGRRSETAWAVEAAEELAALDVLSQNTAAADADVEDLEAALDAFDRLAARRDDAAHTAQAGAEALGLVKLAWEAQQDAAALAALLTEHDRLVRSKAPPEMFAEFEALLALRARGDAAAEECRALDELIVELVAEEDYLCEKKAEYEQAKARYEKYAPRLCPTCGRPLKGKTR